MIGAIVSLLGGSATGIFGNVLNGVFDFFKSKRDMEREIKLKEMDVHLMREEAKLSIQREEVKQEGEIIQAEIVSLEGTREAAYRYDRRSFSEGLVEEWKPTGWFSRAARAFLIFLLVTVDVVRGYTRPVLTLYAAVATTLLCYFLIKLFSENEGFDGLSNEQVYALIEYIIYYTFYMTSMVFSFWFCERNRVKPPQQKTTIPS